MNYAVVDLFDIDLVIIIVVYLLIYFRDTGAGIFALGMGILFDIFSVAPMGLFTFLYLTVFLGAKQGSLFFDLLGVRGQIAFTTIAVFFKQILFVAFLYVFSSEISFSSYKILVFVSSAICTGFIAPLVFYVFNQVHDILIEDISGPSEERE